jgi:hypothetical protein
MDAAENANWDLEKKDKNGQKKSLYLHKLHSHIIQLYVSLSRQKLVYYGQEVLLVIIITITYSSVPQLMFYEPPVT